MEDTYGLLCPSVVKLCSRNLSVLSALPFLVLHSGDWFHLQETGFRHWSEIRKSLDRVRGCLLWFRLTWQALLRTRLLGLEVIFSY